MRRNAERQYAREADDQTKSDELMNECVTYHQKSLLSPPSVSSFRLSWSLCQSPCEKAGSFLTRYRRSGAWNSCESDLRRNADDQYTHEQWTNECVTHHQKSLLSPPSVSSFRLSWSLHRSDLGRQRGSNFELLSQTGKALSKTNE